LLPALGLQKEGLRKKRTKTLEDKHEEICQIGSWVILGANGWACVSGFGSFASLPKNAGILPKCRINSKVKTGNYSVKSKGRMGEKR
jgi:hypothetical protein